MPALILMYHDIADGLEGVPAGHRPYVLDPRIFRRQMESIVAAGLPSLTVEQWCASSRPPRAVILTFDDGHVSNYKNALPILLEYRLKATFFITAGFIGNNPMMDWRQIRALHAAGMEIGSHTLTHRPPSTLDDEALRRELTESRRILEDGLGSVVNSVSSPTGFFNPRMRDLAQQAGYRALCIGRVGLAADDGDMFLLNRVAVKRPMNERQFRSLLRLDRLTIGSLKSRQWLRDVARRSFGYNRYVRLRRILMKGFAQMSSGQARTNRS